MDHTTDQIQYAFIESVVCSRGRRNLGWAWLLQDDSPGRQSPGQYRRC
jgi:hypothetical protein